MSIIIGIPYTNCEHISEIPCTTEAEVVAFAYGMIIGGEEDILVFMQDAGFLSALNVIVGLGVTYNFRTNAKIKFISTPEHHLMTFRMAKNIYETLQNLTRFTATDN